MRMELVSRCRHSAPLFVALKLPSFKGHRLDDTILHARIMNSSWFEIKSDHSLSRRWKATACDQDPSSGNIACDGVKHPDTSTG